MKAKELHKVGRKTERRGDENEREIKRMEKSHFMSVQSFLVDGTAGKHVTRSREFPLIGKCGLI